jgi:putative heme-binding domain-containing protein
MTIWLLLLLAQGAAPSQTDRGEALFLDAAKGCGSCHQLKGKGTPAGPDLRGVARLSPKGIAMAVRSSVSQYVVVAKLKTGESFNGFVVKNDDNTVTVWDLSKTPPEPHKVAAADVTSSSNQNWKHPPSQNKLTDEQMADVVAYIRFAGANNRAAVSPDDVK